MIIRQKFYCYKFELLSKGLKKYYFLQKKKLLYSQ